jgi:chaperone modulatory protein CbpM
LKRLQIALRLQQDLDINLPGSALILDLLEEMERLKR